MHCQIIIQIKEGLGPKIEAVIVEVENYLAMQTLLESELGDCNILHACFAKSALLKHSEPHITILLLKQRMPILPMNSRVIVLMVPPEI